jgi:hypothetical protein
LSAAALPYITAPYAPVRGAASPPADDEDAAAGAALEASSFRKENSWPWVMATAAKDNPMTFVTWETFFCMRDILIEGNGSRKKRPKPIFSKIHSVKIASRNEGALAAFGKFSGFY